MIIRKQDLFIYQIDIIILEKRNILKLICYFLEKRPTLLQQKPTMSLLYPCRRCMKVMSSERVRQEHMELCRGINTGTQCVRMPKEGDSLNFKDYASQIRRVPIVIYADFECSNIDKTNTSFENPCGDPNCKMCERHKKRTVKEASQEANSYCYITVRSDGVHNTPVKY